MWPNQGLKKLCETFYEETQGLLTWTWDEQFTCALAQFSVSDKDMVLGILERFMDANWDQATVEEAPEIVVQLAEDMGGIRGGQLLFTTDTNQKVFVFGAWWPWQDGQTISLRVAPYWDALSDSESDDLAASFRVCFGL